MNLKDKIRIIQDFPKSGISFKDITTLLQDRDAYKYTVDSLVNACKEWNPELIVGPKPEALLLVHLGLCVGSWIRTRSETWKTSR